MEHRSPATNKDGFGTSKILKYGPQTSDFRLEIGSSLTCIEKDCRFLVLATMNFYLFSSEMWLVATLPSYCAFEMKLDFWEIQQALPAKNL